MSGYQMTDAERPWANQGNPMHKSKRNVLRKPQNDPFWFSWLCSLISEGSGQLSQQCWYWDTWCLWSQLYFYLTWAECANNLLKCIDPNKSRYWYPMVLIIIGILIISWSCYKLLEHLLFQCRWEEIKLGIKAWQRWVTACWEE